MSMIFFMSLLSSYFVWYISTRGDGVLMDPSTWSGKDSSAYGSIAVLFLGLLGVIYVFTMVKSRPN